MRARILTVALLIAFAALPVPASQLLAEPFSASAQGAGPSGALAQTILLEDPFTTGQLTFTPPKSWMETEPQQV